MSEFEQVLPLIDRMIKPIADRLDALGAQQRDDTLRIHTKLDEVVAVAQRISVVEGHRDQHETRLSSVEAEQQALKIENAELRGRNAVIAWMLALIGAPIIAALSAAGLAQVFHISLGG